MKDEEFKELILNYNFASRIPGLKKTGTIQGKRAIRYKNCPCCGGTKWHFIVFPDTNSYCSFTQCCKGGDAFNYLVHVEKMSTKDAYKEIENSANGSVSTTPKKVLFDLEKKDLTGLHIFFSEIVQEYKITKNALAKEKDPIQKTRIKIKKIFFEKYVDIFINADYYKDYEELTKITDNFFKLYSEEVIKEISRIEKYL